MRNENRSNGRALWLLLAAALLALTACGPSSADTTPTISVDAIFTAAIQTFTAQEATQLALTPPTPTPSPTPPPTLPPPSPIVTFPAPIPTIGGGTLCDNSAYVADVTIPDGTVIQAGKSFVKTWRLQNTGTCAWTISYSLAFDSGEQMGGAAAPVAVPVPPGNQTEISVNLVAPTASGNYTGTWRMHNAQSIAFGNFITVVIKVGGATATAGPSPTAGPTSAPGMVTISGNAGATDTLITFDGTGSNADGTVTSAQGGAYSFTVPKGWSGTVTPSKGKYIFTPSSKNYNNLTSDQTLDFTATLPSGTATATSTP